MNFLLQLEILHVLRHVVEANCGHLLSKDGKLLGNDLDVLFRNEVVIGILSSFLVSFKVLMILHLVD